MNNHDYNLLVARLGEFVSESISSAAVTIVGAGSVGSYLAEHLVRSGVRSFTMIDPDEVSLHNLSRSSFDFDHVSTPKVAACDEVCKKINPSISFKQHHCRLEDIPKEELRELIGNSSLVIACTDDPGTQALVSRMTWATETVAVFAGLYRGAKGGEIAFSVPGLTPCMECTIGGQRKQQLSNPELADRQDYGTGRLEGEVALGCNIHHVSTAALRIILDLLCITDESTPLGAMTMAALEAKTNLLLMGMEPNYWFFPDLFQGIPGQHTFQSVWVEPQQDSECGICGERSDEAPDPFSNPRPTVSAASIHEMMARPRESRDTGDESGSEQTT